MGPPLPHLGRTGVARGNDIGMIKILQRGGRFNPVRVKDKTTGDIEYFDDEAIFNSCK